MKKKSKYMLRKRELFMKNCFRIGIKAVGWRPIFIIKVEMILPLSQKTWDKIDGRFRVSRGEKQYENVCTELSQSYQ